MAAEDEGVGVLDADPELLGDERPEPGAVEHAGHAEHALAREPDAAIATWHIASSGFVTTMRIASGEWATAASTTAGTIPAFFARRSSRLMPGWRASRTSRR
jgi:hypothetical protein